MLYFSLFCLQIEAIRRGLLKVLSQAVLDLLTWQELERRVCGDPDLAVEALKKCSKCYWKIVNDWFTSTLSEDLCSNWMKANRVAFSPQV